MKRLAILLTLAVMLAFAPAAGAAVATFEDVYMTVPPATTYTGPGGGQYYNGSDSAGGFQSSDYWFTNNYNTTYGSWDGWAYSNTTDTTTAGYTNQFSAITGGGADGSANYGVSYYSTCEGNHTQVLFGFASGNYAQAVDGFFVTNTTYAYDSMVNGDSFAKKFGGADGTDPDWFRLTAYGLNASYDRNGGSVAFYLADYRFDTSDDDYIVTNWTWLDLTALDIVYGLEFDLSSSDNGAYGMNTPAYFAMDNLEANPVPVPAAVWLLGSGLIGLVGIRRRKA
ncbi:MAG: VPLPA-CTERM sorting domain-containing protein [Desulfosarcina sp.]|nr:VPLPA-CTERM sorting domain-containing protein [Desulfobacterales bacterium]